MPLLLSSSPSQQPEDRSICAIADCLAHKTRGCVPRDRDPLPLPVYRLGFSVMEMGSVRDGMKKCVRKVLSDRSPSRMSSTKTTPAFSSKSVGSGIRMFVCVEELVGVCGMSGGTIVCSTRAKAERGKGSRHMHTNR